MIESQKNLWIDALENGDYSQAKGSLEALDFETQESVGFCCLGVACDLATKAGIAQRVVLKTTFSTDVYYGPVGVLIDIDEAVASTDSQRYMTDRGFNCAVLPKIVAAWLGDPYAISPEVKVQKEYESGGTYDFDTSLAGLNDGGYTFGEIAQVIADKL